MEVEVLQCDYFVAETFYSRLPEIVEGFAGYNARETEEQYAKKLAAEKGHSYLVLNASAFYQAE